MSQQMEDCKHDGRRNATVFPPDAKTMTQQRMEWCAECGKLLDDREWKIPSPEESKP